VAVFVGTDGGTPSEIGFHTTINRLAVAILEDPAGGRTWQVKGDLASARLNGIPGLTAAAATLAVDVNAPASDGTYVNFALIDAAGDGADGSLTVMAGGMPVVLDYAAPILKTSGDLSLDIFGYVVGTAAFEITQATADVVTGNTGIPGSGRQGRMERAGDVEERLAADGDAPRAELVRRRWRDAGHGRPGGHLR
jgi:hypothetical protein